MHIVTEMLPLRIKSSRVRVNVLTCIEDLCCDEGVVIVRVSLGHDGQSKVYINRVLHHTVTQVLLKQTQVSQKGP